MDNLQYARNELLNLQDKVEDIAAELDKVITLVKRSRHVLDGKCPYFVFVYSHQRMGSDINFFHLCKKSYGHEGRHEAQNFEEKSALNEDYEYYITHKDKLMSKYPGRFVLIKDGQVHGDFDSIEEAHKKALELFGNVEVFIQEMTKNEPVNVVLPG